MNSMKPRPLNRTEFFLEDRTHLSLMLSIAFPRRLQAAKDGWVRPPDSQKDDRWTHGQVNRSQGTPEQDKVKKLSFSPGTAPETPLWHFQPPNLSTVASSHLLLCTPLSHSNSEPSLVLDCESRHCKKIHPSIWTLFTEITRKQLTWKKSLQSCNQKKC